MDNGELLTRWSVRVALLCYGMALSLRGLTHSRRGILGVSRFAWTLGAAIFLLHVGFAFHFYHGWSHAAAYAATAERTRDLVGWNWGGGLFANYLFAVVWILDVIWWWIAPWSYRHRPAIIEWGVQGFLAFLAFNGTVIFGEGLIRWFGMVATVLLLGIGGYRILSKQNHTRSN